MNHPTSAQCYEVARLLRTVAKDHPLGMMVGTVSQYNICGTYLCHAGAYYASKIIIPQKGDDYKDGAATMAYDLGFSGYMELEEWAKTNPDVWGNEYGRWMFCSAFAFINSKHLHGAESISDIADHWEMVGYKIKETYES